MKITIDTVSDSKEDLRKLIELLQKIVGEHHSPVYTRGSSEEFNLGTDANIFGALDDNSSEKKNVDMFGNELHDDTDKKKEREYDIQIVDDF